MNVNQESISQADWIHFIFTKSKALVTQLTSERFRQKAYM